MIYFSHINKLEFNRYIFNLLNDFLSFHQYHKMHKISALRRNGNQGAANRLQLSKCLQMILWRKDFILVGNSSDQEY